MVAISEDTKEFIVDDILYKPALNPIYKTILEKRNEDKSIELWVCWAKKDELLTEIDNVDDGGSWFQIYGFLFDDDNETDRTNAAQVLFLIGWLEILIFEKKWIKNTINNKDYFQFMEEIHQLKDKYLQTDQFIFSEQLEYSIDSMEKWQNYLILKEKIPSDITSLQNISESQKDILISLLRDEEITDLRDHINDTIDNSFSQKQKKILDKIIEKGATPSSIKQYINELKLKAGDEEINLFDQIIAFVKNNEKLIFVKNPRFLQKKRDAKIPWQVFTDNDLHSTYYQKKDIDGMIEKKFPGYQEKLKAIQFHPAHGSKRPSITNMITWVYYLTTINYRDKQMKEEESFFKSEKKKQKDAEADNAKISEKVQKILSKVKVESYKGLTQEEKDIIDQKIKESPKILRKYESARLSFTKKKITEDYNKRQALKEAAKEKISKTSPQKQDSLWNSLINKLKDFAEQMSFPQNPIPLLSGKKMNFPQAAVSLVTAGMAAIIISYSIYFSGPAKFNINLKVIGGIPIRAGGTELKEFDLKNGDEIDSDNKIRIIAKIDKAAFVYIISYDSLGNINLINKEVKTTVKTLVLPSKNHWYPPNYKSGDETIYLIASKRKIKDIEARVEKLRKSGIDNINKIFKKAKIETFRFSYK